MKCPMCREPFETPAIEGGWVRCPHCTTGMFQYRLDGEDMTPAAFMKLLSARGNDAIWTVRPWFEGRGVIQSGRAAAFVFRLWPTLAQVFVKEQEAADA